MLCGCSCSCSCCASLRDRVQPWLRDYDRLQHLAVIFIYIQIGCALIGSLGALYNGVLLINLAIALFALVAIESSSQSLARTYAVLLLCAVLLDISWFTLFSYEIWNISSADYGFYFIFSIKLTLAMQIVGCCFRVSSSFLWIQMYRLGVDTSTSTDFDLRNSFLNPVTVTPALVTQCSHDTDDVLGGSIYDPPYYSSLFEDTTNSFGGRNSADNGSTSDAQSPQLKVSIGRSFQAIDEENASIKPPTV